MRKNIILLIEKQITNFLLNNMKRNEVVAAIIEYKGKILCMQRKEGKYEYVSKKYEFPGGKIELGETRTQALVREIKEELDIDIHVSEDNYFMSINHVYPDFEITMHSFYVKVESPYFVMKEHLDYKWLDVKDLKSLDWAPADEPIIEKLMSV